MSSARYDQTITLPRALKFPLELVPPDDFDPQSMATWPKVTGHLEYAEGKLLYMPPSGDLQQDTTADVVITLGHWVRAHPGFVLGTNEAGMHLAGATRAADAAIWRRADLAEYAGGLRRVPPLLAVEVAGAIEDETQDLLREKARWYIRVGVAGVWIVVPEERKVLVITADGESAHEPESRLLAPSSLPDLAPLAGDFFRQIDGR